MQKMRFQLILSIFQDGQMNLCSMHKPHIQAQKLCNIQLLLLPLHVACPPPTTWRGKSKGPRASVAGKEQAMELKSAKESRQQLVSSSQQDHSVLTANPPVHTAILGRSFQKLICEVNQLRFEMAPS